MKALATLILSLIASIAIASTSTTVKPGPTVMAPIAGTVDKDGKPVLKRNLYDKDADAVPGESTHDRCLRLVIRGTCNDVFEVATVTTCADEPAPVLAQEQRVLHSTLKPGSDTDYEFSEIGYIHNPAWPAGFPNCWILGDVPARITGDNEGEPVMEPVTWPAELQAKWDASCADRHIHHVFYPEDACA